MVSPAKWQEIVTWQTWIDYRCLRNEDFFEEIRIADLTLRIPSHPFPHLLSLILPLPLYLCLLALSLYSSYAYWSLSLGESGTIKTYCSRLSAQTLSLSTHGADMGLCSNYHLLSTWWNFSYEDRVMQWSMNIVLSLGVILFLYSFCKMTVVGFPLGPMTSLVSGSCPY